MSKFQRNILKDGKVTYAEYESAIVAQRTCLQEAGYSPGEIHDIGFGQIGFSVDVDYSNEPDPAAADAAFLKVDNHCRTEYSIYVATAWSEGLVVSDPSERERLTEQFASCLKDAGLDVSRSDSLETLMDSVQRVPTDDAKTPAVNQCAQDSYQLFVASTKN